MMPIRAGVLLAVAMLGGCGQFQEHRSALSGLHSSGNFRQAATLLDSPEATDLYGDRNRVLWMLDRGALAQALGEPEKAIELLEDAERAIETSRGASAAEEIGAWIANDTVLPYQAEPYEDIYLNVIKLLANLELGRLDGGATVEARRLAGKANILRDRYVQLAAAANQQRPDLSEIAKARGAGGGLIGTDSAGQFVESPLGTYLTAVTFMKTGDRSFQEVAGRRLVDALEIQKGLVGGVRTEDFVGVGEKSPDDANVLVVALSGRGPIKTPEKIGPIAIASVPIYLELPKLRTFPSAVASARIIVNGEPMPGMPLKLVEDLGAVAAENHRRQMPLIYTRTFVRYLIKAGVTVGLTEGVQANNRGDDDQWIRFVGGLIGLGVLLATEKADLRAWEFLPGQARVALTTLPPGEHRVSVEFLADNGAVVYTAPERMLTVTRDGLATGVFRYWR